MPKVKIINNNTENGWEVKIDTIKECGKQPEEMIIWFEPIVRVKINALMNMFENIEWLAYLIGDPETRVVTDIHIPTQKITSTSVDDIECPEFNDLNCIGVIHSHHGMGNGFSGTDHEWINQNHNISLCIANNGIAGQVRWKTPCGGLMIIECEVKLKLDVEFDEEKFKKEVNEKISRKTYTYHNAYGIYNANKSWTNKVKSIVNNFTKPDDKKKVEAEKETEIEKNVIEETKEVNLNDWDTNLKDDEKSLIDALKEDGFDEHIVHNPDDINEDEYPFYLV